MTGTCKTCKWWDMAYERDGERIEALLANAGVCRCPSVSHGHVCREWGDDPLSPDTGTAQTGTRGGDPIAPSAAIVEGYDGLSLRFVTGPDFGCVHWEAKA